MSKMPFYLWVIIIILELMAFSGKMNYPHSSEDDLFYIVIIVVTLVVGIVGLFYFRKNEK